MLEQRVQYGIDNFIEPGYFEGLNDSYVLTETREGKTRLDVHVDRPNLCIADFDSKKKCNFLNTDKTVGMQKSSDHIIFYKTSSTWKLCIIEMKTSVGGETWRTIKQKTRASLLNSLAIASFLGITIKNEDVQVYTTYEIEAFNKIENVTAPVTYKLPLGGKIYDVKKEEWDQNRIKITLGPEIFLRHKAVQLQRNEKEKQLEGELFIEG